MDDLYDFLLEIGMKPFVELSFIPGALRSNDATTCYWKAYKSPPASYEKYGALIEAFVRHLEGRYGHDVVKTWRFEVWNEPNLKNFFTGTRDDYFKVYAAAARAIKRVSADFRVGGPASAGTGWLNEMMDFCEKNLVPLDFISTHFYGNSAEPDGSGKKVFLMRTDPDAMPKKVKAVRAKLEANALYRGIELQFNEFSSSFNPFDPIHDAYQSTPYLLNALKKTEGITSSLAYWAFTDIIEEIGEVNTGVCFGGWGLMDAHGLKKPAFFAYKYLNQLGETELINPDEQSWVCRTASGVQALLWQYTLLDQEGVPNNLFYKGIFPAPLKQQATLRVENLKNGSYRLEVYRTGYQANDTYTAYANMGAPKSPGEAQMKLLAEACADHPVKSAKVQVTDGVLTQEIDVHENDVYLLKAEWVADE